MRELSDFVQIIRHPADQMPRFVIVEKPKRQLLNVLKHFPPHFRLDIDAQHMSPIGDDIVQYSIQRVNA
ncbi:hypothetical protein D3C77_708440 [compost metagenome]